MSGRLRISDQRGHLLVIGAGVPVAPEPAAAAERDHWGAAARELQAPFVAEALAREDGWAVVVDVRLGSLALDAIDRDPSVIAWTVLSRRIPRIEELFA